jgi:hypothetical protein
METQQPTDFEESLVAIVKIAPKAIKALSLQYERRLELPPKRERLAKSMKAEMAKVLGRDEVKQVRKDVSDLRKQEKELTSESDADSALDIIVRLHKASADAKAYREEAKDQPAVKSLATDIEVIDNRVDEIENQMPELLADAVTASLVAAARAPKAQAASN